MKHLIEMALNKKILIWYSTLTNNLERIDVMAMCKMCLDASRSFESKSCLFGFPSPIYRSLISLNSFDTPYLS